MSRRLCHQSLARWPSRRALAAVCLLVFGVLVGGPVAADHLGGPVKTAGASDTVAAVQERGESGEFGFGNGSYRVDPPETVEMGLNVSASGVFTVVIESPGDQFDVELTVGYSHSSDTPAGSGPTVLLDTGSVAADDPREYLSVRNATIHRITVREHRIDEGSLPGGQYHVRAIREAQRASATLDVTPSVRFDFASSLNRSTLERDPVRRVTGDTDLPPGERLTIRVSSTGSDAFRLENETVVGPDGRFETVIDLGSVPAGADFVVTAHHDNLTRARQSIRLFDDLPTPVDGGQMSDGITFAYEGEQLSLASAPNQTISGETTLEEGAVLTIVFRSPESHLHVTTVEVGRHGSFEATVNLEHLRPRTDVIVSALSDQGATGAARVVIVEPDETGTRNLDGTTREIQLDAPDRTESPSEGGTHFVGGIVAIALGVALSLVASGLLLGIDRSWMRRQR